MAAPRKGMPQKAGETVKAKKPAEIDFGAGKISFGGMLKGLGQLIELADKLKEEGAIERRGEIKGLPGKSRAVYGVSVRTLAGKPVVESFGNVKGAPASPVVEEVLEPIVDIFDEKDHFLVIAEIPGVSEDKVTVDVNGDILSINATDTDRKYSKEVLLPGRAKAASMKRSARNGILEIRLDKESRA